MVWIIVSLESSTPGNAAGLANSGGINWVGNGLAQLLWCASNTILPVMTALRGGLQPWFPNTLINVIASTAKQASRVACVKAQDNTCVVAWRPDQADGCAA